LARKAAQIGEASVGLTADIAGLEASLKQAEAKVREAALRIEKTWKASAKNIREAAGAAAGALTSEIPGTNGDPLLTIGALAGRAAAFYAISASISKALDGLMNMTEQAHDLQRELASSADAFARLAGASRTRENVAGIEAMAEAAGLTAEQIERITKAQQGLDISALSQQQAKALDELGKKLVDAQSIFSFGGFGRAVQDLFGGQKIEILDSLTTSNKLLEQHAEQVERINKLYVKMAEDIANANARQAAALKNTEIDRLRSYQDDVRGGFGLNQAPFDDTQAMERNLTRVFNTSRY